MNLLAPASLGSNINGKIDAAHLELLSDNSQSCIGRVAFTRKMGQVNMFQAAVSHFGKEETASFIGEVACTAQYTLFIDHWTGGGVHH